MSVNCVISLPDNVRVRDVAKVIAIAAGCGYTEHPTMTGTFLTAPFDIETTCVPEMVYITFDGRQCSYHFEGDHGGRTVLAASTPFWIAIAKRVVRIFGGCVDFNDSDASEVDYSRPAGTDEENRPKEGDAWQDLMERIKMVEPIHISEMVSDDGDGYSYTYGPNGRMIREIV